jgi:hypothetical protein
MTAKTTPPLMLENYQKKHQPPFSAKLKNNKENVFRGNKKVQKPLASGLQIIKPE